MKAFLAAIVACLFMVGGIFAQDEEPKADAKPESKTVSFADATEAPANPPAATGIRRRVLADREARRLGITFGSVRAAVKELKASGSIDGSESNSELAAIVADHISSKKENEKAFKAGAVDWDALISFISKLLEIILKFFP